MAPRKTSPFAAVPVLRSLDDEDAATFPQHEMFLPVHGFVKYTSAEVEVINHPAVQRLGRIFQLGMVHLVFRGATHTRLEHSLGAVAMAARIADAIADNQQRWRRDKRRNRDDVPDALSQTELIFARLGALLHDVGHLPAGHTIEDELHLLPSHDYPERLLKIFTLAEWPGGRVETLADLIDRVFGPSLRNAPYTASELVLQIIAKKPPRTVTFYAGSPALSDPLRIPILRDIVGNTICADLLDYLQRDWHHIGKPRHLEDRLLQYMEIQRAKRDLDSVEFVDDPRQSAASVRSVPAPSSPRSREAFVISLGSRPRIRADAVSAVLELLESRYDLGETVLFHRTKLAFAAMLERAIQEIGAERDRREWTRALEDNLLHASDHQMIEWLFAEAVRINSAAGIRLLTAFRQRRVYGELVTRFFDEYPADVVTRLADLYADEDSGPTSRLDALRKLEDDFSLTRGALAIYFPAPAMNAKIARVKISVDGQIAEFDRWEGKGNAISGGHLTAQQQRFNRLWRVHVVIDRREELTDEAKELLYDAVNKLVLPKKTNEAQLRARAASIARHAFRIADQKLAAFAQGVDVSRVAARGDRWETYPTGAPCLRNFIATNNDGSST